MQIGFNKRIFFKRVAASDGRNRIKKKALVQCFIIVPTPLDVLIYRELVTIRSYCTLQGLLPFL